MPHPKRSAHIEIRKVDRDLLVHDLQNEKIHVLNGSAGHVLEMCDGTNSASDIARSLCGATGADLADVSGDVDAILREFVALQLVSSAVEKM